MTLEELTEKDAIRDVIDRFSTLELDVDSQAKLFTEDAHIEVFMNGKQTMDIHGREDMIKQFGGFSGAFSNSYHMNGQQVISLDGDNKATDTHYCMAALIGKDDDGNQTITNNYIRYTDTLVKVDGNWLISNRHQEFVFADSRLLK